MELATATSGGRKGARWWKADGSWREQRLRQRIGEGYLYDEIASELGCTVGMVCGKADRMRVGRGAEKRPLAILWPKRQEVAPREPDPSFLSISARQRHEAGCRGALTVHLEKLESHHCRFVIGDPAERRFCGVRRKSGSSYCPEHAERCSGQLTAVERDARAQCFVGRGWQHRGTKAPMNSRSSGGDYLWNINVHTLEIPDAREPAPA